MKTFFAVMAVAMFVLAFVFFLMGDQVSMGSALVACIVYAQVLLSDLRIDREVTAYEAERDARYEQRREQFEVGVAAKKAADAEAKARREAKAAADTKQHEEIMSRYAACMGSDDEHLAYMAAQQAASDAFDASTAAFVAQVQAMLAQAEEDAYILSCNPGM